jgi:predicted  nucleic acid-binding Zn-ribbon protein
MPEAEIEAETESGSESVLPQAKSAANGVVDVHQMRTELDSSNRVVNNLRQEMQQLRNQVQRTVTSLKQLEARVARR